MLIQRIVSKHRTETKNSNSEIKTKTRLAQKKNTLNPRRASLSVRITDKNGDHAEAGKIWENWFFTRKMDPHGPKCTQIDEGTCQGVI